MQDIRKISKNISVYGIDILRKPIYNKDTELPERSLLTILKACYMMQNMNYQDWSDMHQSWSAAPLAGYSLHRGLHLVTSGAD